MSLITQTEPPSRFPKLGLPKWSRTRWSLSIAIPAYAFLAGAILLSEQHVPTLRFNPHPILQSDIFTQVHIAGAISTMLIGIILMNARKGFKLHRTLGWAWVGTMSVTALSSFFITSFSPVHFSPIHALSAWTMISLPMAIAAVRRRDIGKHRKEMTNMFVGGMVIAGLFSFMPGRLMWITFFG